MCQKCKGRGFIESAVVMEGASHKALLQCCDVSKYSAELARRMNRGETDEQKAKRLLGMNKNSGTVLPFKRPER